MDQAEQQRIVTAALVSVRAACVEALAETRSRGAR
jgi:hypothetical protein